MKEKAVGLWNRIATKENKQIAKNVLLILLVSRLFYIFIGCVTNSAFGNNITFAKMFLGGDADWYIKIAEKGYSLSGSIKPGDGQANWAFFPLFPVSIRLFKYIFFFLNYAQAGIFLSLIYVYIMGIFLVKTVRLYKPDRLGYFAVVLVYMGPYSFYLHCVYSETLFMMLIAVFFYYLKKEKGNINNYWISAAAAMLASCTRIVGVILVFPLVLQMYLDLYEGRITFGKLGSFIVHMFKNPVKILQVLLCPAGIFVNMMHLYYVTGDAWAFRNVQAAWREDGAGWIGNMIWDFFNNIYAERYWIPLVMILAIIVYVYMLKCRYYSEVLFAVITLIIPFTGGVMSMCRFIAGSYVVYIGLYDYFADKKDLKWLAVFLAVVMEAFLIWLWFTAGVNAFTA